MEQLFHSIISGKRRGAAAWLARLALRGLEPCYAAAVRLRNYQFDSGRWQIRRLSRPVVSVGNLTVGGTGKTPVVAWLADELRERGRHPAVLMRGYKARPGEVGDEQALLRELLGESVPVEADRDRCIAGNRALEGMPVVDVFLLDDAFQHRQIHRGFDLVLIDATRPFGHDHLLPRGLLREPLSGLARASAVLLTRCELTGDTAGIEAEVRRHTAAPIFCSSFAATFASAKALPVDIAGRTVVAACGIGNPDGFFRTVERAGGKLKEMHSLPDHHDFSPADVDALIAAAGGDTVVVTSKDWVKLRNIWPASAPVAVARQTVHVEGASQLLSLLSLSIGSEVDRDPEANTSNSAQNTCSRR